MKDRYLYKFKKTLVIVLILCAIGVILSPYSSPDYPILFRIKRAQEKAFYLFKVSMLDKTDYARWLVAQRLLELIKLSSIKEFDLIYVASLRYAAAAGELTDLTIKTGAIAQREQTIAIFRFHKTIIQELIADFPNKDSDKWKFLQDDINYLDINLDRLVVAERK